MINKGNIISFAWTAVFTHLKNYLRLFGENSTSQMPSDQSDHAAREVNNCAHILATKRTGSCWPTHWLFWQTGIDVFLCPLGKHMYFLPVHLSYWYLKIWPQLFIERKSNLSCQPWYYLNLHRMWYNNARVVFRPVSYFPGNRSNQFRVHF